MRGDSPIAHLLSWRPPMGGLARSTLAVLVWNIARLAFQLFWVVVLAKALGAAGYGTFSGVAGLAMALSGLVGAGLGLKMYHDVSRIPEELNPRWAQASLAMAWTGVVVAAMFVLIGTYSFPELPLMLLAVIAASELVVAPRVAQTAFGFASLGKMQESATVPALLAFARVVAALGFAFSPWEGSVVTYGAWHLVATLGAAFLANAWFRRVAQIEPRSVRVALSDYRAGLGYTSVWASSLAMTSVDKAAALRHGGGDLAGNYSVAQRFAGLAALPIDALATAVLPRLFRAGPAMNGQPRLLGLLATVTAAYGMAAGSVVWWTSPWVVALLGEQFESAVPAMKILAIYVPLYCLRSVGGTILLGFNDKLRRFVLEIAGLVALVLLMAHWVPKYGVIGAALALTSMEAMLALLFWVRIVYRPLTINGNES